MRVTEEELQALLKRPAFRGAPKPAAKTLKYRNVPTEVEGKWFASKLEASYYTHLKSLWALGSIAWFCRQIPYDLPGGVKYRADFFVMETNGKFRVIDCKGHMTEASRIKIAQVEEIYGFKVEIITKAKK